MEVGNVFLVGYYFWLLELPSLPLQYWIADNVIGTIPDRKPSILKEYWLLVSPYHDYRY